VSTVYLSKWTKQKNDIRKDTMITFILQTENEGLAVVELC